MAHFFGPAPSLNFNYKVNFKEFLTKLSVCLLTHERYKTYQTGFSFGRLGHAPGVGLGGTLGGWECQFFFSKFFQIWCVRYLHEWNMHLAPFFGPDTPGVLGRGQRSNII